MSETNLPSLLGPIFGTHATTEATKQYMRALEEAQKQLKESVDTRALDLSGTKEIH